VRLLALGVGAVLVLGQVPSSQDSSGELRFHHLHLRVDDPAAAMTSVVSHAGGARVILQGLGVGVRLADQYLLFDRLPDGIGQARPYVAGRAEAEYAEVSRWLQARGFRVAVSELRAGRAAAIVSGAFIDHVAFATANLEGTLARLRERGIVLQRQTGESAMLTADGLTFEVVHDTDRADAFWCPMHPDVRSPSTARCPICSMDLVRIPPPTFGHYRLEVTQVPKPDGLGLRSLKLAVRHPETDQRITSLTEIHERLLHLFVIGRDLTSFAHVHPERSGDAFEVPIDLAPGTYVLIADFVPAGGAPQLVQHAIVTPGYTASPFTRVSLAPDDTEKVVGGLRITLAAEEPRAGKESALRFTIRDAASGEVANDLEPYLGAAGHLLVVNPDLTQAIHAHPEGVGPISPSGDILFAPIMPAPGVYKMWVQVQRRGTVVTAPFVVAVR
jgi:hypothetical protein